MNYHYNASILTEWLELSISELYKNTKYIPKIFGPADICQSDRRTNNQSGDGSRYLLLVSNIAMKTPSTGGLGIQYLECQPPRRPHQCMGYSCEAVSPHYSTFHRILIEPPALVHHDFVSTYTGLFSIAMSCIPVISTPTHKETASADHLLVVCHGQDTDVEQLRIRPKRSLEFEG